MRDFGVIHTRYWIWAVEEAISSEAKLLGAYLLTSGHSNSLGCYRLPKAYVQADLGYDLEKVATLFAELAAHGFLCYCEKTSYLLLPHYLKWNPVHNKNHGKAVEKLAAKVPSSFTHLEKLREALSEYGENLPSSLTDPLRERVSTPIAIGYGDGYRNKDQDQDHEHETDSPPQSPLPGEGRKDREKKWKLPEWLPKDLWAEFKRMRLQIKAPLTGHAEQLALDKLARLVEEGEDPRAVLEQSVYNCWKSFYKIKPQQDRAAPGSWQNDDPTGDKAAAAEVRRTRKYISEMEHG